MEKFGLVIVYGRKRLHWDETYWTTVTQRKNGGHYLLNLVEDPTALRKKHSKTLLRPRPPAEPETPHP